MMTYTDRALLQVEWVTWGDDSDDLFCPCCGPAGTRTAPVDSTGRTGRNHAPDCDLDCALSERGYLTQGDRDTGRLTIRHAGSPTDPAPPMTEHSET